MRTLYLHVGHGKTGSSYLQSAFVKNRAALAAHGLTYPEDPSDARALAGGITIGNGRALIQALRSRWRAFWLIRRLRRPAGHVLFSSEFLFGALSDAPMVERLEEIARDAGFDRIEILLFIRDPLDHLPSFFQQKVKREGFVGGVRRISLIYPVPLRVASLMRGVEGRAMIGLTVRNYSRRRNALLAVTSDWAGLPEDALAPPARAVVNRSLTRAELLAQRVINRRFGRSGRLAADRLCEDLPDIEAEHITLPRRAAARMIKRLSPAIEYVNSRVEPADRYQVRLGQLPRKRPEPEAATITAAQFGVIIDGLTEEMRRRPLSTWLRLRR